MRTCYLDASALVKLATPEAETHALRTELGTYDARVTSRLATVEVARALRRRGAASAGLGDAVAEAFTGLAIVELDEAIAQNRVIDHWILHDIRRSVSTHMHEIGIEPHVVEAIINHVSGHRAGVAGTYNRARYREQKRIALQAWADWLEATVEGREPRATS